MGERGLATHFFGLLVKRKGVERKQSIETKGKKIVRPTISYL